MPTGDTPTLKEADLLKALAVFHYFTAEKLAEYLGYSTGTIRDIKRRLKQMEQKQLVEVANKQIRAQDEPFVYTYGKAGHAYLKSQRVRIEPRYRPAYERIHKAYPLGHTMVVNVVLLKALLLEEETNYQVTLTDHRDEPELKAKPLIVQLPQEPTPTKLSPDLWLDFQAATRRCFCIEVNLSKVWQRDFRHRIRTYLHCLPAYEEYFGTDNITIVFVVGTDVDFPKKRLTESERARLARQLAHRFTNFVRWTEAELTAWHMEAYADAFLFTKAPLLEMTAREFYFSPHCVIPFDPTPRPLMRLTRKEAGSG